MEELVTRLTNILPTFPFEAAQGTKAPYATYELSETPIRTKEGIVGHEGVLTISLYTARLEAAMSLAECVIEAIDGKVFDGRKLYYSDIEDADYPDVGLSSKTLTFNTLT